MKLPSFDYACPATIAEAVALLAAHGGEAKPIAGGQSLVPMLAFRLTVPSLLVDLRKLSELRQIKITDAGIVLGAMVRWRDILEDRLLRQAHPLLTTAVEHIAHYQIRNRGTVGGSLAHADPAAELPGIAVTCDADIVAHGSAGPRAIAAAASAAVDPANDIHASGGYRKTLIGVMVERALHDAIGRPIV